MLIVTTKLSKKKLAIILGAVSLLVLSILFLFPSPKDSPQEEILAPTLSTNEARLELLSSCGLEALPEPISTLDLQLPSPLDERYTAYNQLQLQQGFDLTAYCGKNLTRYTYAVTNYTDTSQQGVQVNLYLFENTLVAADLFSAGENGFIAPLFAK